MSSRMQILLGVVFWLVVGGLAWTWLKPSPPPASKPTVAREPSRIVTFTGNVRSVKVVTRGNAFTHYDIEFSGASNGQDTLRLYKKVAEDSLRPLIGRSVTVTCLQAPTLAKCHWLTRLEFEGREIATQEATSG